MHKDLPDIIIPHHNRWDLIGGCLQNIPMDYKVFIVRGFYFAQACNRGASLSKADRLLFLNDDVVLTKQAFKELQEHDEDIVGLPLRIPSMDKIVYGMNMYWGKYGNVDNLIDSVKTQLSFDGFNTCQIPATGAAFMIKRRVFEKLGGLNEDYVNGGEDNELFLTALEQGYSFGHLETICDHFHSSSQGRYDNDIANHRLLTKHFPKKRLLNIVKKKISTDELISVIIPTRILDKEPHSIESLKKQTHKNIEIIIVRDKDQRGASWARNEGRKRTKGNFLFFCDDDIELKPLMLEVLLTKLFYSNASFSYCNYQRKGSLTGQVRGVSWDIDKLKRTNYISTMSLIKAEDFPEEGFDESLERFQDWDLWLAMAEKGKYGVHIDETLFTALYNSGDISCQNPKSIEIATNYITHKHNNLIINQKENPMINTNLDGIQRAVPSREGTEESTNIPTSNDTIPKKIELGSKTPVHLNGDWTHLDTQNFPHTEIVAKAFSELPLEDGSVDEIYAKRVLQRIGKPMLLPALKECFRVLKPVSEMTIICVDVKKAMGKFLQTFDERYLEAIFGTQKDLTEIYLSGYTPEIMIKFLQDAGFIGVKQVTPPSDDYDRQLEFVIKAETPKAK